MVIKGMILLVIVLILVKYLGRFLALLLTRAGIHERKAAYSLTGLHILVLLIGGTGGSESDWISGSSPLQGDHGHCHGGGGGLCHRLPKETES